MITKASWRSARGGYRLEFGTREHLARGIGRIAEDEGLGARRLEGGAKLVRIKGEIVGAGFAPQVHADRLGPREDGVGQVVFVEGREDDDLVAGIDGRHDGGHHRFGGAAGDRYVVGRVDGNSHEAALLRRKGFAEVLGSPGHRVLVGAIDGRARGSLEQGLAGGRSRESPGKDLWRRG